VRESKRVGEVGVAPLLGEVAAAARCFDCAGDKGEVVIVLLSRKWEVVMRLMGWTRDVAFEGG
jgi:hypothetical protein